MFIYISSNHVALTSNNVKEVLNLTWNYRSRWRFIGIELGIDVNTLDTIERDHRKAEDCLTELITIWLCHTNPKPTRIAITKALESQSVVIDATIPSEGIWLKNLVYHCLNAIKHKLDHCYSIIALYSLCMHSSR